MPTSEILAYHQKLNTEDSAICEYLSQLIHQALPTAEGKIWHGHPVWFLDENPTVGYSKQKKGIRLMFWSGADFEEERLNNKGKKFKDASIFYTTIDQVNKEDVLRWLQKSTEIQWDYKNIVKHKGRLERLK